ncbi:MAG: type III ribulose-bisphosphate carboxylase [Candidatus Aenigmatarchaeota archaeon]
MKFEWYLDFVKFKYRPKNTDIVCLFRFEPSKDISKKEAIGRIASESSCGTWTTLALMPKSLYKLKAYAFWQKKDFVKIAYPFELFEEGSIPGFLSGPAGNVFGMKAVKNLKFIDASFPLNFIKHFKGPNYGRDAIKKIFKRKQGPITAVVPKPKLGFSPREHAEKIGLAIWKGGMDCLKDDENLVNQKFNRFEERVKWVAKCRDKAEKITGDVKDAFINVTSPNLKELERRIKLVHNYGFRYFMLDIIVSGFTAIQTAVDLAHDLDMAIHGHRAMHAMLTRNPKHGMSMLFLAKLARLMGIDQLHIGTVIGKLEGNKEEIIATKDMIMAKKVGEIPFLRLSQNWGKIKPMLPVASGGLHPGILPQLFNIYGTTDMVIQVGGGTQGHPMGAEAGARAIIQAIEAYRQGISLKEYAKTHKELKAALDKWGFVKPI